jgi:hypothetical protein
MEPEVTTIWDDPNKPTFVVRLSSPMTRRGRLVGTYLLAALFSSITYGLSVLTIPGDAGDSGTIRAQGASCRSAAWCSRRTKLTRSMRTATA